jgi:hypothetical protein
VAAPVSSTTKARRTADRVINVTSSGDLSHSDHVHAPRIFSLVNVGIGDHDRKEEAGTGRC